MQKERPKRWQAQITAHKYTAFEKPFVFFNWLCKWISYWLGGWAFLEVLEYLGKLGLIGALAVWLWKIPERQQAALDAKKTKHYVAWQTINSAIGKSGNGGRSDALRDLNEDRVPLDGIALSGGAVLVGPLDLSSARMQDADLSNGKYDDVNFSRAWLYRSQWDSAQCDHCKFQGAAMWLANFSGATFRDCDFSAFIDGTHRSNTILHSAYFNSSSQHNECTFEQCSFVGAVFSNTTWSAVSFESCNFAFANLSGIRTPGPNAHIDGSNLYGASNASPEFVIWAYHQPLVFTNITTHKDWIAWLLPQENSSSETPEFLAWASNQWANFEHTNEVAAWNTWRNNYLRD